MGRKSTLTIDPVLLHDAIENTFKFIKHGKNNLTIELFSTNARGRLFFIEADHGLASGSCKAVGKFNKNPQIHLLTLKKLLRTFPHGRKIKLIADDDSLTFQHSKGRFTLPCHIYKPTEQELADRQPKKMERPTAPIDTEKPLRTTIDQRQTWSFSANIPRQKGNP